MPDSIADAISICEQGGIAEPYKITVDSSEKYPKIVRYEMNKIPEYEIKPKTLAEEDFEKVPF